MGVIRDSLRSIFTKGRATWLRDQGEQVLQGISDPIETVRTEGRTIMRESWPGTAIDTIPQWHRTLGVVYDVGKTLADHQIMLEAMMTAQGSMAIGKLQEQIQKEFPGITITETLVDSQSGEDECGIAVCGDTTGLIDYTSYNLIGEVNDDSGAPRLLAILARYAPAHMSPVSDITILTTDSTSEAGVDECGLSIAEGYEGFSPVAPAFSVAAFITGTAAIGTRLYAYPGTVTGSPTPSLSYQWKLATVDIPGATSNYFDVVDGGSYTCVVTATNDGGSASSTSAAIATQNIVPVLIWSGSFTVLYTEGHPPPYGPGDHKQRTPTGVSVSGYPSPVLTYSWTKNGAEVSTIGSYIAVEGDANNYQLTITAANIAGSDSKSSAIINPW